MSIQVALTHDNPAGLTDVLHAPHEFSGLLYAEETYAPNALYRNGAYCILSYRVLRDTEFAAQNDQFGLTSAEFAAITLRIPGDVITSDVNYNGQIIRPRDVKPDGDCYYNIAYLVRFLEAI